MIENLLLLRGMAESALNQVETPQTGFTYKTKITVSLSYRKRLSLAVEYLYAIINQIDESLLHLDGVVDYDSEDVQIEEV